MPSDTYVGRKLVWDWCTRCVLGWQQRGVAHTTGGFPVLQFVFPSVGAHDVRSSTCQPDGFVERVSEKLNHRRDRSKRRTPRKVQRKLVSFDAKRVPR